MSNQSEYIELRSDIKKQTESINDLTVSIAQLLEGYKHHKEVTEKQGVEIKAVSDELKELDDKFDNFVLNYKPFLDGAIKDKEKKSDRLWRVIMGWFSAAVLAIAAFVMGIVTNHYEPDESARIEQKQNP